MGKGRRINKRMETHRIEIIVNGKPHHLEVKPMELLLNVLRERMGLTGIKYGCGIGECGACTVLMEGQPVLACLTLAVMADGKRIVTIEGLEDHTTKEIQDSFLENGAVQCGFCTPGMITMSRALIEQSPKPAEAEIREHIKGNICRCTGYVNIIKAIRSCAEKS